MDLTTPALLLSTISLLLLAYTNRFLAIASVVRKLHEEYKRHPGDIHLLGEIHSLRKRIRIIRDTQTIGVISLLFCVLSMFLIFNHYPEEAQWIFGAGLILLMVSLCLSTVETYISTNAINIHLHDLDRELSALPDNMPL